MKRAFARAPIDPNKFLAGFFTGLEAENAFRDARQREAEFFFKFPEGAGVVRFTGIEMASGGGIPAQRESVLFRRALLEEHLASGVIDENVDRTVAQATTMHFTAG